MADTYFVKQECTGAPGEIMLGIYNKSASKVAKIWKAGCTPQGFFVGTMSLWRIVKISAWSGGDDPLAGRITKWDSNDPNIPALVQIKLNASVTQTENVTCRIPGIQTFGYGASQRLFATMYGQASGGQDWSTIRRFATFDAGVQNLILREGEGMAIVQDNSFGVTYARDWEITLKIGTAIYTVCALDRSPKDFGDAMISIFNAVGSGVVVEILAINTFLIALTLTGCYAFGKFNKRLDVALPDPVPVQKMDSASPDLPADIKVYNHVLFDPWPEKHGIANAPFVTGSIVYDALQMFSYQNTLFRFIPSTTGKAPNLALGMMGGLTNTHQATIQFNAYKSGIPIEVNQNDCVGYYIPPYYGWGVGFRFEFWMEFTIENASQIEAKHPVIEGSHVIGVEQ